MDELLSLVEQIRIPVPIVQYFDEKCALMAFEI